jgi:hypothetical protein
MTKQQLNEIRERCEAATSAPWYIRRHTVEDYNANHICGDFGYGSDGDKAFIAHARADVPALLDEVERVQKERGNIGELYNELFDEVKRLQRCETALLAALKVQRICWCCANDSESTECQTCKHCSNWRFDYKRFGGAVDAEVQ